MLARHWSRLRAALLAALLACLPVVAFAQEPSGPPVVEHNPFEDLPKGHPAYAAIEELVRTGILEGYPDGMFRGDKVITRYDLALSMARAAQRLEDLKREGRPPTPEEQQLIDQLNREVGVELGLLGVRVESLERRVAASETRANNLELQKSNVSIAGFYRLENSFVFDPVDFGNYPFVRELNPFLFLRDRGLVPLKQEVFLRFTGRPVLDGLAVKNVDAFAELRGIIVGNGGISPQFNFSPNPVRAPTQAGDVLDDFPTLVNDEARVFINRAHFVTRTKNLNFRAFSNESATDLTDPNVLFTVDTLAPFAGVEATGAIQKFSYFTSVLKDIRQTVQSGLNERDVRLFDEQSNQTSDIYTLRMTYEPFKEPDSKPTPKTLTFGGTFVERALNYTVENDFFRTMAWDISYVNRRDGRLDTVLTFLHNQAPGDLLDTAVKFDGSYAKDGFLATLKAYRFGPEFRTDVAQNQFVDSDVSFNFHRLVTPGLVNKPLGTEFPDRIEGLPDPSNKGERLLRLQLKNDWQGKNLNSIQNLVLSSLWETKSWARDQQNPLFNDDENGHRFYVQAVADITRRWHVEANSEVQKDIRIDLRNPGTKDPEERGAFTNVFRSDWRLRDNLSFIAEFQHRIDLDSIDNDNKTFRAFRQKYEFPWQAHRRFFLKLTIEHIAGSDLQAFFLPVNPIGERDLTRQVYETNWVIFPKWSLKGLWVTQKTENARLLAPSPNGNIRVEDNITNIAVAENIFNFTPALKLRHIFAIQNTNLVNHDVQPLFLENIDVTNNFAELVYTPTPGTEMRMTYGFEFENPNDPFDNGPAKFFRTQEVVQFKAQTDF